MTDAHLWHTVSNNKKGECLNYSDEFEQVWKSYPKRNGGNPKPKAFKAFTARLKEKVLHDDLRDGVLRYCKFCKVTGLTGSPYVMQASTFFGVNNEAWAESWEIPKYEKQETMEDKGKRLHITPRLGESMSAWKKRIAVQYQ